MTKMKKHFLILLFWMMVQFLSARETINFNSGWKFFMGDPDNAEAVDFDDSGWVGVNLPHDWAISGPFDHNLPANTGKLPWKGVGWYRKHFDLKPEQKGKQIYLVCDGIMAFPKIYLNGQLAGQWDYGYNSFYLNITELVNFSGSNLLAICADTREHDSRWYPGAGIYRKIEMLITDPIHVNIWGTYITTPVIAENQAEVNITTTVNNSSDSGEMVVIENHILDQEGKKLSVKTISQKIPANSSTDVFQTLSLENYHLWDIEFPVIYKMQTIIKTGGFVRDIYYTDFGIRTIEFTTSDGFYLNGKRVQIKGVNLHHDHGPLGAKFYPRAMERQLEIMKEIGCNAIRTSHNVAAPELLSLCDSMGFLVLDEIFDKWDQKADFLKQNDFLEFGERNIRNFVLHDRNHPCVFIWSVGNEMGDIQWNIDDGLEKLKAMVEFIGKYDETRPVTMVCDSKESVKWRHFDYYDVHCWNYGRRYLPAREMDTTKAVIISESSSTVSTRGFYEFPLPEKKNDFTNSLQVSSYDLNAPEWAEIADDDFLWQQEDTYVAGEFVWTGFDYLGEPTPYNDEAVKDGKITKEQSANSSYFGITDMCGIPKDRYYLYRSYWSPEKTTVHILPHWNWEGKEGQKIPVFVYTNGDCAELFLNGKSLGKRCKKPDSEKSFERFRIIWDEVVYQPGELKVVAYNNNVLIGESSVTTAGEPHQIKLTPDRNILKANGSDLCYILVEAFDKDGIPCPLADNLVHFKLNGPSVIEAVGNGDPQSVEPFISDHRSLFYGKAMLIIRTLENKTGNIKVTSTAQGLKSSEVTLTSY
jgi:beta-galactosidase